MLIWKIKKSPIHGNGVFARENIQIGTDLGVGLVLLLDNIKVRIFQRRILGLLVNHSTTPNLVFIRKQDEWSLRTIKQIQSDEELTVNYEDFKHKINKESKRLKKRVEVI